MAGTLVDSLHDDFRPDAFVDGYRDRVLELVHAKARGEDPELPESLEYTGETDLAAALEASLNGAKNRGSRDKRTRPAIGATRAATQEQPHKRGAQEEQGKELKVPRSLWTGSLSFGLVNVPVSLVPAVRDLDLHFRQLHAAGSRARSDGRAGTDAGGAQERRQRPVV